MVLMNLLNNLRNYYKSAKKAGKTPDVPLTDAMIDEIKSTVQTILGEEEKGSEDEPAQQTGRTLKGMHEQFQFRQSWELHPGSQNDFTWYIPHVDWRQIARPVPWLPSTTNRTLSMQGRICFEHTTDACGRAVLTNPRRFEIAVQTASDPETWCSRDTDVHFALVGHGRYQVSDWQPPMTIPDDFRVGMVVTEKTWYKVL